MKQRRSRCVGLLAKSLLLLITVSTALLLLWISTNPVDPTPGTHALLSSDEVSGEPPPVSPSIPDTHALLSSAGDSGEPSPVAPAGLEDDDDDAAETPEAGRQDHRRPCATVEEMGEAFAGGSGKESLRVREVIRLHFDVYGAARVRELPPHQFCHHGFVIGKASEAGFGNEMYKILTAAALSVMLNRSLIIGQTRGLYPFGDYISYTTKAFTLKEVKHLWRKNDCAGRYGRNLVTRVDNFEKPTETNVLCSDWRNWKQPIIWFQGTTDAVAIQFFLKSVHPGMKNAASVLFGQTVPLQSRPNVFGELMRVLINPSPAISEAVNWVLKGADPEVALHMRMLTNRSARAVKAALECIRRALLSYQNGNPRPRVVLVSDTPSFIKEIMPNLTEFAEVLHFNYKLFEAEISSEMLHKQHQPMEFRTKDWGPAPRWVAFVDFFLASRAQHAVVSGAHRRVGTTYAQLIAALAATNRLDESSLSSNFSFLSSFQSNLLVDGLANQVGWGHVWNRFAGPLTCRHQPQQCAITALLPTAWWDSNLQSPIPRDIHRLQAFGVRLSDIGEVIESSLQTYCQSKKEHLRTFPVFGQCKSSKCT